MHNLTSKGISFAAYDSRGNQLETNELSTDAVSVNIPNQQEDIYFLASTHFLGNQIHSYNQGNPPTSQTGHFNLVNLFFKQI